MRQWLSSADLILMEASVVERIRRNPLLNLHPRLVNAPLIYDGAGRRGLTDIYQSYMDIAQAAGMPLLLCSPTWRTNRERVTESAAKETINRDAVSFLMELRARRSPEESIRIAGMIGCKNDCYTPEEGLSEDQAARFHAWQVEQLAEAGVDMLIAETLPAIDEAVGIARAMALTGLPYIISFVIGRHGRLLDLTSLSDAIQTIDRATGQGPLGYMVNCAHPGFLCTADQPSHLFSRLIGYQANASSLDHCHLEGASQLQADPVPRWSAQMLELNLTHGVKILGGCCGTGEEHLKALVGGTSNQT